MTSGDPSEYGREPAISLGNIKVLQEFAKAVPIALTTKSECALTINTIHYIAQKGSVALMHLYGQKTQEDT